MNKNKFNKIRPQSSTKLRHLMFSYEEVYEIEYYEF